MPHTTAITFNGTAANMVSPYSPDRPFAQYAASWAAQTSTMDLVRSNVWRHSDFTQSGRHHGPNVLFADGHCEATVDIFNWTDDNVSLKAQ